MSGGEKKANSGMSGLVPQDIDYYKKPTKYRIPGIQQHHKKDRPGTRYLVPGTWYYILSLENVMLEVLCVGLYVFQSG